MAPTQLAIFKDGESGRDAGIKASLASAGKSWTALATGLLYMFLQRRDGTFMTEDVRKFAHDEFGLPMPPDGRAWGGIIRAASAKGDIVSVGFGPVKSPNCHMNPKTIWRKA